MNILHFGINIKEKPSNYINKAVYLLAKAEGMYGWKEKDYDAQRLKASLNYDLNMRYFEALDENSFNIFHIHTPILYTYILSNIGISSPS